MDEAPDDDDDSQGVDIPRLNNSDPIHQLHLSALDIPLFIGSRT